jgi:hypothetical protein
MEHNEAISKMIDDIIAGNNTEAEDSFKNIISSKVSDALDQRKIEVASNIYNNDPEEITDEPEEEA